MGFQEFRNEALVLLKKGVPDAKETDLIEPPEGMGDLGYPCFNLAKLKGVKPNEAAKDLQEILSEGLAKSKTKYISEVRAYGPYVNFYIDWSAFASETLGAVAKQKEKYGRTPTHKDKVMVEYAQPNTHKAFHIGHVRNLILGEALCRIFEATGRKAVRTNYQG